MAKKKTKKTARKSVKKTSKKSLKKPVKKSAKKSVKKRPVKRRVSRKSSKKVVREHKSSIEADIQREEKISQDIAAIEKDVLHDEKLTGQMEEKIEHLNEKVHSELKDAKSEIKLAKAQTPVSHKRIILWAVIAALIIILISVGFNMYNNYKLDSYEYNSYRFNKVPTGEWEVEMSFGTVPFYHHPSEVDQIPVDSDAQRALNIVADNDGQIVISLDPDYDLPTQGIAVIEISKITTQLYNIPTLGAVTKETSDPEVPIATCQNSGIKQLVYEVRITGKNEISYDNECIILEARSEEELSKVTDAYIYRMLGVIA